MSLAADTPEEELKELALSSEKVRKYIDGKQIIKEIVVPGTLVNIVVKDGKASS
jgi:leucyl-tRNA synthetase